MNPETVNTPRRQLTTARNGTAWLLGFVVSFVVSFGVSSDAAAAGPVAIVCSLDGHPIQIRERAGAQTREDLELFERLVEGAVLETGSDSEVVVGFINGQRERLQPSSRAVVRAMSLEVLAGEAQPLQPVATLPLVIAVDRRTVATAAAASIRVRLPDSGDADILRPRPGNGAIVLAGSATLSFEPIEGVPRYRLELADDSGQSLWSLETERSQVELEPDLLQRNARYTWSVRTLDEELPTIEARSAFSTLSENDENAHADLAALAVSGDLSTLLLLAELERQLGLAHEACTALERAMRRSPGAAAIGEAASRFGCG